MVTSDRLTKRFGNPTINTAAWERQNMIVWRVPPLIALAIPELPSRIYCHKLFAPVLDKWFTALVENGLATEINTFDGCWNVRNKRGLKSLSIHAWGMAVDLNASHNPLGLTADQCKARNLVPFSPAFIAVSRHYVDCGADWLKRPDGMHFQVNLGTINTGK